MEATEGNGVWLTVSDLARRQGVSKGPVSRRVARLEAMGALTTRAGERGTKLVNVAEFLKAVDQTEDVVRATNGGGSPDDPIYAREQARNARIQGDIRQLELDERLGKLVPVTAVESAMARCAEAMVRKIDQLPAQAEDCAAAVARDGVAGARTFLKEQARSLRERLAAEMRLIAAEEAAAGEAA